MATYEKFYGERTFTLDITVFTQDYHTITHTTVAEMLQEEGLLHKINTVQISTCHRHISICFKSRQLLLEFCEREHILLQNLFIHFIPDYHERIRISIENLPIELPDEEVRNFLSRYTTPIGKTHYTGKRYNNKYYTTETRVYLCIHLEQHIPRHVYEFGRYLRIRYDSQPTTAPSTTPQQNATENTLVPENQENTPETQQDSPPDLPQETPNAKNEQNYVENLQHTPIPQQLDTPNLQQRTKTTIDPEGLTDNRTLQRQHEPIQKPEQQSQTELQTTSPEEHTDNHTLQRQHEPIQEPEQQSRTELQTTDIETDSESDSDTDFSEPTLSNYEKQTLTQKEQNYFLYWRGKIKFGGYIKKRYELYPNKLYRHISENMHKNERMCKAQLKRFFEKTTTETKYGLQYYYKSYKEEEDYLRQQCRGNDIRYNIL